MASNRIATINQEIANTEKKLIGLQKDLDTLIREKETAEATAIYRYVKANHISVKDFAKSFSGILDASNTSNTKKQSRGKQSKQQSTSKSSKNVSSKASSSTKRTQTKSGSTSENNKKTVTATK